MKSHLFDTPRKAPGPTVYWICGAFFCSTLIQGCLTPTSSPNKTVGIDGTGVNATVNQNKVVPVEVSARIEGISSPNLASGESIPKANAESGSSEIRFRESGEVGPNRTLRISQIPSDAQQAATATKPAADDYHMEVKAVALNTDNVVLEIEVFNYDKAGKRISLSKPRLVVQYGDAAEIQELNAAPDAAFSRLSLSVLPGRPRLSNSAGSEGASQDASQKSDSGTSK